MRISLSFGTFTRSGGLGGGDRASGGRWDPGRQAAPGLPEFFVDDAAIIPIYRALAKGRLILLFHSGVDIRIPPPGPLHARPPGARARSVPGLTVIAAHGRLSAVGGRGQFLIGRDLYLDASYSLADLGPDALVGWRVPMGSSACFLEPFPWTDQATELAPSRSPLSEGGEGCLLGCPWPLLG